jgi:hypothetical protein
MRRDTHPTTRVEEGSTGCDQVSHWISEFLDGELEHTAARTVAVHLSCCPRCATMAAQLALTIAALHRLSPARGSNAGVARGSVPLRAGSRPSFAAASRDPTLIRRKIMNALLKNLAWLAAATTLAVPAAAIAQAAQAGSCPGCAQGSGSGPRGHPGARMFDPSSVTTVQGDVDSVDTIEGGRGQGVHLTLAMGSEKLVIVLGPKFYLDEQPLKVAKGDRIEVKGSRVTWGEQPALVAQEIKKGNEVLQLRDSEGIPLWSWRARR